MLVSYLQLSISIGGMDNKDIISQLNSMAGQIKRKPKSHLNFTDDYQKYCEQFTPSESETQMEQEIAKEWIDSSKQYAKELGYEDEAEENNNDQE